MYMNISAWVLSDRWDYLCSFAPNIQITLLYISDKIASKDMQRVCVCLCVCDCIQVNTQPVQHSHSPLFTLSSL